MPGFGSNADKPASNNNDVYRQAEKSVLKKLGIVSVPGVYTKAMAEEAVRNAMQLPTDGVDVLRSLYDELLTQHLTDKKTQGEKARCTLMEVVLLKTRTEELEERNRELNQLLQENELDLMASSEELYERDQQLADERTRNKTLVSRIEVLEKQLEDGDEAGDEKELVIDAVAKERDELKAKHNKLVLNLEQIIGMARQSDVRNRWKYCVDRITTRISSFELER